MRLTFVTICLVLGLLMEVALEFRPVSAAAVALGHAQRLRNVLVRSRATVGLVPRKSTLFAGPRQAYDDEYFDYEDEEEDEQAEEEEELQAALSETGAEGAAAAGGGEQYEDEEEDDEGGDEQEEGEGEDDDDEARQLKRKYLIHSLLGIAI